MNNDVSKVKAIFYQAIESDRDARADYLAEACANDQELRREVEALLHCHDDVGTFLETPVVRQTGSGTTDDRSPTAPETRKNLDSSNVDLDFLDASDKPGCIGMLASYEIIEVLGLGGMGIVLRALDTKLNRVVAIKVLAPQLTANAAPRKRFEREAQAAAAVSHDHVVTIFAVDEHRKLPYIVMECIDGRSLQQLIDDSGPLDVTKILRIGMQTASGLAAAHVQGLIHRDIKPVNILLENGIERVKITDFGLARAIDDASMTLSGQTTGTPLYMSPEQAEGKTVDYRSDLFSLGSVLYTMCTGRPAFRADSSMAVLRRVCEGSPRPIREVNPQIPEWLVNIVDRLLSKNPTDRFQSAAELSELLAHYLAQAQQPAAMHPTSSTTAAAVESRSETKHRSMARIGWLSATTVVLIVAGALILTEPIGVIRLRNLVVPTASSERNDEMTDALRTNVMNDASSIPSQLPAVKTPQNERPSEEQLTPYEILTSNEWEWTEPVKLAPEVNTEYQEGGPCLSADRLTLLFSSDRPGGPLKLGNERQHHLWLSRRESLEDSFGVPEYFANSINGGRVDRAPAMSADGLTLIFSSRRPGSIGRLSLWMSERSSRKDFWAEPVQLGPSINKPLPFYNVDAHLSPDGLTTWYMSHLADGGDWFWQRSQRADRDKPWSAPITLESGTGPEKRLTSVTLSGDGLVRVFAKQPGTLWLSSRPDWKSPWGPGLPLSFTVSKPIRSPFLSADGRTLMFIYDFDVWMIHRVKKN